MSARWHDLLDAQVATRASAPAFSDALADWDYAALDAACRDLGEVLESVGVRAGDRVVCLCENSCAAVATLFACSRMGAVVVPVNARQTAREVDRVVAHCEPAAMLFTSAASLDAAGHAERLGATQITGAFGEMHLSKPFPSAPDNDPEIAVLLYTTGTTGTPKGVMLTHANLRFGGAASATLRNMVHDDLIYGVLPMTHVFGLSSIVTAAVHAGAPVRLEARFTPAKLYQALTHGVTLLSAVPQMHALLMHYTREQGFDRLPSQTLRYVSSGAAPLDPAWKREAEAFYGVAIQNGYGMTETTAGTSVTQSEIGDPDTSVGPPLPGVEVMIDESVPGGGDGAGEVLTRGPHIMKGYYRNPEATAAVLDAEGWMHTGDLGRIDDVGRLHILGRSKELIIHGGFNVYPPEVEAVLSDHPQVIQSAVVGRKVGGDEEVLAFIQVSEANRPDPEELRTFAAERLAGYKRPRHFILASELPAAPTGKILKHRLLEYFKDQLPE